MTENWTRWDGGECPVDPETTVIVRYRADGADFDFDSFRQFKASQVLWGHYRTAPETDIVAYRRAD
jgi:hypothetical protein